MIDPGGRGGGEADVPAGAFGDPIPDQLGLVRAGVVHGQVAVQLGGGNLLHCVEELVCRIRSSSALAGGLLIGQNAANKDSSGAKLEFATTANFRFGTAHLVSNRSLVR